jgi:small neutral amino acid transporter SnatA (MarC family)
MNTSKKQLESISEIKRQRTAARNTVIVMALLFVALVSGGGATSTPNESLSTGDLIWGGFSVIAFASLIWSLYIAYKQADERKQLIQLKANSLAFVVVIFSIMTAQILHALDIVSLNISIQIIVIGGILLWTSLMKVIERRSN